MSLCDITIATYLQAFSARMGGFSYLNHKPLLTWLGPRQRSKEQRFVQILPFNPIFHSMSGQDNLTHYLYWNPYTLAKGHSRFLDK